MLHILYKSAEESVISLAIVYRHHWFKIAQTEVHWRSWCKEGFFFCILPFHLWNCNSPALLWYPGTSCVEQFHEWCVSKTLPLGRDVQLNSQVKKVYYIIRHLCVRWEAEFTCMCFKCHKKAYTQMRTTCNVNTERLLPRFELMSLKSILKPKLLSLHIIHK